MAGTDAATDAAFPADATTNPDAGLAADAGPTPDATTPDAGPEDTGATTPGGGAYFPPGTMFFQRDVSASPVAANSAAIIASLRNAGGWGNGDRFQIDFSIEVLTADPSTPRMAFTETSAFFDPDCDRATIPMPAGGALEGEDGYECVGDGDCHLIVFAPFEDRLYEMWRANVSGGTFFGGCLAVWETDRTYDELLRGEQCTSADAAGFPIAPLLFSADEVAAGEIDHAIRFILPNDRVRASKYVRPATHGTRTTGDADAPPYGVHFRLRADYPVADLPNDAARVVARALQRYGMYHADGGNIALTAQSDRFTMNKWADLGLGSRDLAALDVEDFEVIDHGPPIDVNFDCVRTP